MAYRYFITDYWDDPYIETLTAEQAHLYCYFFTSPRSNTSGLYEITKTRMTQQTKIPIKKIEVFIQKFIANEKIMYDPEKNLLWVINYLKHQANQSPYVKVKIAKELKAMGNHRFVGMLLKKYYTLSIPYPYPMDTLSIPVSKKVVDLDLDLDLDLDKDLEKDVDLDKIAKPLPSQGQNPLTLFESEKKGNPYPDWKEKRADAENLVKRIVKELPR